MADKFDAVVEAVRYTPDGQVEWVRVYERRGPTFSDRVLVKRSDLIEQLKAGKKFVVGTRVEYEASTFKVSDPIKVVSHQGEDVLVVGNGASEKDNLAGVPGFDKFGHEKKGLF